MGEVIVDMSLSLDGFVAGPGDMDGGLHDYYFSPSGTTVQVVEEGITATGAIIMGRRSYDQGDQVDGFVDNPYHVPHFVLSHTVPTQPARGETTFHFVADGIESALAQAKAAAGDKHVVIGGGAQTAQQFISAGLVDELQLPRFVAKRGRVDLIGAVAGGKRGRPSDRLKALHDHVCSRRSSHGSRYHPCPAPRLA